MSLKLQHRGAMEGESDLSWIDARYRIAVCVTKHAPSLVGIARRKQSDTLTDHGRGNNAGNTLVRERDS